MNKYCVKKKENEFQTGWNISLFIEIIDDVGGI